MCQLVGGGEREFMSIYAGDLNDLTGKVGVAIELEDGTVVGCR